MMCFNVRYRSGSSSRQLQCSQPTTKPNTLPDRWLGGGGYQAQTMRFVGLGLVGAGGCDLEA
eukprot:13225646-Alexandrium_andersonii.AAC.1